MSNDFNSQAVRGPPGIGFQNTADYNFDIDSKRLSNVFDVFDNTNAVSLLVLKHQLQQVLINIYDKLEKLSNITDIIKKVTDDTCKSTVSTSQLHDLKDINYYEKTAQLIPDIDTCLSKLENK